MLKGEKKPRSRPYLLVVPKILSSLRWRHQHSLIEQTHQSLAWFQRPLDHIFSLFSCRLFQERRSVRELLDRRTFDLLKVRSVSESVKNIYIVWSRVCDSDIQQSTGMPSLGSFPQKISSFNLEFFHNDRLSKCREQREPGSCKKFQGLGKVFNWTYVFFVSSILCPNFA